jgi:hypothetical protein
MTGIAPTSPVLKRLRRRYEGGIQTRRCLPIHRCVGRGKDRGEIGRKFLCLDLEVPPGAPNELGVVEDVVGGSRLKGFDASVLLRLGSSKTPHVCVTESNQGGEGTVMGWPLELGEDGGERLWRLKSLSSSPTTRNLRRHQCPSEWGNRRVGRVSRMRGLKASSDNRRRV